MKRKLIAFSMTLALVFSVLSTASAHFVEIESKNGKVASRSEWFGLQGEGAGSIVTQRNAAQHGEVIFNDATGDQRLITATGNITRAADLDWFGVTADANNLYLVAKVERYQGIEQTPPIELMISIDRAAGGNTLLPDNVGLSVPADAAWEYVIDTRFSTGSMGVASGTTTIYNGATGSGCGSSCQAQLASSAIIQGSFAEIAIPWSKIGGAPGTTGNPPVFTNPEKNTWRFTVASFYKAGNNPRVQPPLGSQTTPVVDVLDRSKTVTDTENAIADGVMDTGSQFDVHFDTSGTAPTYEPYAPLLITEIQANPIGDDNPGPMNPIQTESEYIEIYNPNSFAISLNGYKIGNATTRGSSKFMRAFKPNQTIGAKGVVVVAKSKTRFLAGWNSRHPGMAFPGTVYDATSDLTNTAFASGTTFSLDNQPASGQTTFGDQAVLLDATDGIIDLVEYGNRPGPYPGTIPILVDSVAEGSSFERCPASLDTNGGYVFQNPPPSNTDYVVHASVTDQTPGEACVGRPGIDMQIEKTGPAVVQVGKTIRYELRYSNVGMNAELPGTMVTIDDTLPTGVTFTNAPANASPAPTNVTGQKLTWTLPAPGTGGVVQTIVFTGTVASNLGENTPLTNTVTIASPNELKDANTQVNNTATWTAQTSGPARLGLQLQPVANTNPGQQFTLELDYQNTGASPAADGVMSLTLPAGITLLSSTSTDPGVTPNFTAPKNGPVTVSWDLGAEGLKGGATGKIIVVGRIASNVQRGTTLSFSATLSSSDTTPASVTATGSVRVDFTHIYVPIIQKQKAP